MKQNYLIGKVVVALCLASCAMILGVNMLAQAAPAESSVSIERGKYLVNFGGCNDCHTPKIITEKGPELDQAHLLSGHPAGEKTPSVPTGIIAPDKWGALVNNHSTVWAGPWGVTFSTNLTPHPTGLGTWTEEMFVKTMRSGKHLGVGRPILPPMPWYSLNELSDEDLKAVFAYLRSIKPVDNIVPAPIVAGNTDTTTAAK